MDTIGDIPEEFVLEAEYTEEELKRLDAPRAGKAAESAAIAAKTPKDEKRRDDQLATQADEEDGGIEPLPEVITKHKVSTIVWITMGAAFAAAAILLFVLFWNPDRGDVVSTTEAPTSDETVEQMKIIWPVEISETNFPDSSFRRYVSKSFDTDEDGLLSEEEGRAVKEIVLSDAPGNETYTLLIKSVKGIEYFPELEVLDSEQYGPHELSDEMTEMDLTNNPKLRELTVCGKKLTSLDVSHNPNLEKLEIQYVGFTSIDLSHNPNLKSFTEWSSGDFAEVDLTHNPLLEELCFEHANLSALDLSQNPRLRSLSLIMSGSHPLDLKNNPVLEDLYILGVPIEELDLSGNPLLKRLSVRNTSLKKLDLRANTMLTVEDIDESILVIHDSDDILGKARKAQIGEYFTFGTYEQDNDLENGSEDIEWLVLDKTEDRMLVISRHGLDSQPYNFELEGVTWETCSLREWLNNTFYISAFDSDEKNVVLASTVKADANPHYDTSAGKDTTDRIFLLSIDEFIRYCTEEKSKECQRTPYCYDQTLKKDKFDLYSNEYSTYWWLRTPGGGSEWAMCVNYFGSVYDIGTSVNESLTIRPAMWIDLKP